MIGLVLTVGQNLKSEGEDDDLETSPRYVLVGFKHQTVIILVTHDTVMVYGLLEDPEEDSSFQQSGENDSSERIEEEEVRTQPYSHSQKLYAASVLVLCSFLAFRLLRHKF